VIPHCPECARRERDARLDGAGLAGAIAAGVPLVLVFVSPLCQAWNVELRVVLILVAAMIGMWIGRRRASDTNGSGNSKGGNGS
jgi:hypothetical protein